jgi:hypothetical protein
MYAALRADWLAKMLAWQDDGRQPILLLEDLSDTAWPPPWNEPFVRHVLETLAEVRRARVSLPLLKLVTQRDALMRWRQIAKDPRGFLSLGLCSPTWLERALPRLIAAEAEAELDGNDLLHCDLKSGNICFRNGRCILIDWNWACRGNGLVDVADWLPHLRAEGGPDPETVWTGLGGLGALLIGYNAHRASQPAPPEASGVRQLQLAKVCSGLPWICRELDLPDPDLPHGRVPPWHEDATRMNIG